MRSLLLVIALVLSGCVADEPPSSAHPDGLTFQEAWQYVEPVVTELGARFEEAHAAEANNSWAVPADWGYNGSGAFGGDLRGGDGRATWVFIVSAHDGTYLVAATDPIEWGAIDHVPSGVDAPMLDSPELIAIARADLPELSQRMFAGNYTIHYPGADGRAMWRITEEDGNGLKIYVDDRERKAFAMDFQASVPPHWMQDYIVAGSTSDFFIMQPASVMNFHVSDGGDAFSTPGATVEITFSPPQSEPMVHTWTPGTVLAWNLTEPPTGMWDLDLEVQPLGVAGIRIAWCAVGTEADNPACT